MPQARPAHSQIPIVQLVWPLLVENILRTSLMAVDTLMLSRFSEKAVAAMSFVNQYVFFILLIYMMVSVGASIVISQNLGAGKTREAGLVSVGSLALVACVSLVLSLIAALAAGPIVDCYHLEPEVARSARQFLTIFGGLSFFMAVNIAQASVLRSWGYPRDSMWVTTIALLLTVLGNALCLFGPFGFPVLGVPGVACSTVISQAISCLLYHYVIRRRSEIQLPLRELTRIPRGVYRAVLAVGVPSVGENLTYNLSQIVIFAMIAKLGTSQLAVVGIIMALLRYILMPGVSIGTGTQIKVGYLVGAGRHEEATSKVYRYFGVGVAISTTLVIGLVLGQRFLIPLFSREARVHELAASVLLISLIHEPGRNFNTIIIPALKGAGDVRFPVYVGVFSMWGVGVLGAWLLGLHFHLGLVGIWIAMAVDEWLRGIVMWLRWRSGAWKKFKLAALDALPSSPVSAAPLELG